MLDFLLSAFIINDARLPEPPAPHFMIWSDLSKDIYPLLEKIKISNLYQWNEFCISMGGSIVVHTILKKWQMSKTLLNTYISFLLVFYYLRNILFIESAKNNKHQSFFYVYVVYGYVCTHYTYYYYYMLK